MGFSNGMLRKEQPIESAFTSFTQKLIPDIPSPVSDVCSSHFPNWNIKHQFWASFEMLQIMSLDNNFFFQGAS